MKDFRLLVCVDRSPAALAAARLALDLADSYGGVVHAVSVVEAATVKGGLARRRRTPRPPGEQHERDARSVLERIAAIGAERKVHVETSLLYGDALREVINAARQWSPDLILIGRGGRSGPGSPLLGSLATHVIEFSDWPVVVVPETGPPGMQSDSDESFPTK